MIATGVLRAGVSAAAVLMVCGLVSAETVYNNIPSTLAGNYPSLGYQATSTQEFGDRINLGGTARTLQSATITMSSWARSEDYGGAESFTHPITFNIYAAGAGSTPGSLLGTVTQTITVPYRPTDWGFNGIAFNATFDFSSLNLTLPESVVIGVAYNTQTHGYSPLGVSGPYNSLNFALNADAGGGITVGSNDDLDDTFWNTSHAPFYTDGGAGGVGTFRRDTNWDGYAPMVMLTTIPLPPAAWAGLSTLAGVGFVGAVRRRRQNAN